MNYPKNFLWFPIGWKKLGETPILDGKAYFDGCGNPTVKITYRVHPGCGKRLLVGEEGGSRFEYCPVCYKVIKPNQDQEGDLIGTEKTNG